MLRHAAFLAESISAIEIKILNLALYGETIPEDLSILLRKYHNRYKLLRESWNLPLRKRL